MFGALQSLLNYYHWQLRGGWVYELKPIGLTRKYVPLLKLEVVQRCHFQLIMISELGSLQSTFASKRTYKRTLHSLGDRIKENAI